MNEKINFNTSLLKCNLENTIKKRLDNCKDFTFDNVSCYHKEKIIKKTSIECIEKTSAVLRVGYLSVAADACC